MPTPFGVAQEPAGYGSSLVIEELTAPATGSGSRPRRLVLAGPALPFMGADWGRESALTTTWYPGNGVEATQQVLGPKELPSSWEGRWSRTMLGRSPVRFTDEDGAERQLVDPLAIRDVLDDILAGGARLRVTWAVEGTELQGQGATQSARAVSARTVREGRLKQVRFQHDRHSDVRWSAEFHWLGRGGTQQRVTARGDDADVATITSGIESALAATVAAIDSSIKTSGSVPKGVPQVTLGQLEQLANAPTAIVTAYARKIQETVSTFKRVGGIARTIASQPQQVANAAVSLAYNTVAVANGFVDSMGRIPHELRSTQVRAGSVLRAASYFGHTTDQAILQARQGQQALDALRRSLLLAPGFGGAGAQRVRDTDQTRAGAVLAVYVTRAGDTPQRVSVRFYKTPDRAEDLLRANKLPTYLPTFAPGQVLYVPVLGPARKA